MEEVKQEKEYKRNFQPIEQRIKRRVYRMPHDRVLAEIPKVAARAVLLSLKIIEETKLLGPKDKKSQIEAAMFMVRQMASSDFMKTIGRQLESQSKASFDFGEAKK